MKMSSAGLIAAISRPQNDPIPRRQSDVCPIRRMEREIELLPEQRELVSNHKLSPPPEANIDLDRSVTSAFTLQRCTLSFYICIMSVWIYNRILNHLCVDLYCMIQ